MVVEIVGEPTGRIWQAPNMPPMSMSLATGGGSGQDVAVVGEQAVLWAARPGAGGPPFGQAAGKLSSTASTHSVGSPFFSSPFLLRGPLPLPPRRRDCLSSPVSPARSPSPLPRPLCGAGDSSSCSVRRELMTSSYSVSLWLGCMYMHTSPLSRSSRSTHSTEHLMETRLSVICGARGGGLPSLRAARAAIGN